jgi:hypothetical protein
LAKSRQFLLLSKEESERAGRQAAERERDAAERARDAAEREVSAARIEIERLKRGR